MRTKISSRVYALLIVSMASLLVLSGCVTRASYDEVVEQRDGLVRRSQELASVAVSLDRAVRLRDNEIAALEREQQELADEVTRWAVRGAIKMQMLADGLHLILPHDVLFASGTTDLSPEGKSLVVELVQEINQQPYQIAVLGFSDNVPVGAALAERYPSNWELSGARAASVVRVMQAEGIPAEQLVAVSRGSTGAIATNDTPEGRAQNRRIDIRIRPVVKAPS
jgi:chemotaxis protein MotB